MNIQIQQFVTLSDLFDNCPTVAEAFNEADHSNFTWGDCNRSMISLRIFDDWFTNISTEDSYTYDTINPDELDIVAEHLDSLPGDIMIDLEN